MKAEELKNITKSHEVTYDKLIESAEANAKNGFTSYTQYGYVSHDSIQMLLKEGFKISQGIDTVGLDYTKISWV